MIAHIIRLEQSAQGIIGVLKVDSMIFCFTLERANTFIKPGCYHCQRFSGTKWPDTFEIVVPGHTAVLFHAGNIEADTQGCVLLGATTGKLKGERAVLNSGETFKRFLNIMEKKDYFTLFVVNNFF